MYKITVSYKTSTNKDVIYSRELPSPIDCALWFHGFTEGMEQNNETLIATIINKINK